MGLQLRQGAQRGEADDRDELPMGIIEVARGEDVGEDERPQDASELGVEIGGIGVTRPEEPSVGFLADLFPVHAAPFCRGLGRP